MDNTNSSQQPNITVLPVPQKPSPNMQWTLIILLIIICIVVLGIVSFSLHKYRSPQLHSPVTIVTLTPIAKPSANDTSLINQKIATCKHFLHQGSAMNIQDGDSQTVGGTTREFLTLPNDIYPFANISITENNATMGYISNGGPIPPLVQNNCWAVYYEFDTKIPGKSGSVDITATSIHDSYPDFHAHIVVQ